jgi:hypothetical protein
MKELRAQAKRTHDARFAHLGVHSTSAHPGYADGGSVEPMDRARGGKTGKKKGGTQVNILIGSPGGAGAAPAGAPMAAAMPPAGGAMPVMPARPMTPPPAAMPPAGGIGGVAGPMRKRGGGVRSR